MKIKVITGNRGSTWQRSWVLNRPREVGPIRGIAECAHLKIARLLITQTRPDGNTSNIIPLPRNSNSREEMLSSLLQWATDNVLHEYIDPNRITPYPRDFNAMLEHLSERMPDNWQNMSLGDAGLAFGRTLRRLLPISADILSNKEISWLLKFEIGDLSTKGPNNAVPAIFLEPLLRLAMARLMAKEIIMPPDRPLLDTICDSTELMPERSYNRALAVRINLTEHPAKKDLVLASVGAWREFPRARWREVEWMTQIPWPLPKPFPAPKGSQKELAL